MINLITIWNLVIISDKQGLELCINVIPIWIAPHQRQTPTYVPSLGPGLLVFAEPALVPGVSEVHDEDQLDQQEQEAADHTDHHPRWGGTNNTIISGILYIKHAVIGNTTKLMYCKTPKFCIFVKWTSSLPFNFAHNYIAIKH